MVYSNQVNLKPAIAWSDVEKSLTTLAKLQLLTHSPNVLAKDGYVLKELGDKDLWKKMRCQNCGNKMKLYKPSRQQDFHYEQEIIILDHEEKDTYAFEHLSEEDHYARQISQSAPIFERHKCLFHDGKSFKGIWSCCGGRVNTKGCTSNVDHVPGDGSELKAEWLFEKTPKAVSVITETPSAPSDSASNRGRGRGQRGRRGGRGRYMNLYSPAPLPSIRSYSNHTTSNKSIRQVVALDCEMGTSRIGNSVLIRVSLIDFFTKEPLVDSLVTPTVEMAHYNTRYSGVTFSAMRIATQNNQTLRGTDAARSTILNYVDSETTVIVHGGNSDFTALRWIHPADKIIDSYLLEAYDYQVREMGLRRGLKEVCQRRCGISVQDAKLSNGKEAGHDSLEDALAAREIVCAWLSMIPDQ